MNLSIFQKQNTQIAMTNQLSQAIHLLQYSTLELEKFITEEFLDNPLIEIDYKHQLEHKRNNKVKNSNDFDNFIQNIPDDDILIWDKLLNILKFTDYDKETKKILSAIISNLNERGYLEISDVELMKLYNFKFDDIYYFIELLQTIAPKGTGARNVKECLLLQIDENDEVMKYIVKVYLSELIEQNWDYIFKEIEISKEEIEEIKKKFKKIDLNPFINEHVNYDNIYDFPDIIIEKIDSDLKIVVNDFILPNINVNQDYLMLAENNKEIKNYINKHYRNYKWILTSLEKRKKTIVKVMESILKKQPEFFQNSTFFILPMTLENIAEDIGMNKSTVSRTVKNKVVQTPVGTFNLKDLFSQKVYMENGEFTSSLNVKKMIREYIEKEMKNKPLSDEKISKILKKDCGIQISRRTINKYREEMKVPPSFNRKLTRNTFMA